MIQAVLRIRIRQDPNLFSRSDYEIKTRIVNFFRIIVKKGCGSDLAKKKLKKEQDSDPNILIRRSATLGTRERIFMLLGIT